MLRSMSSAVAGLRAQQTAMDVIGNNIANVNTAAFKASQTTFSDMFYQTLAGGSGTVDPSQVGYGAQVAGVSKNMTSSGATQTDNPLDLFIDGEGFFIVNTKSDGTGGNYYTRLGSFKVTTDGYLCDQSGNYVMGVSQDVSGNQVLKPICLTTVGANAVQLQPTDAAATPTAINAANYNQLMNIQINNDGTISASLNNTVGVLQDGSGNPLKIALANFLNSPGLTQSGNSYYTSNTSSGAPNITSAGNNNSTVLRTGRLEMSNVDLSSEFTNMIVTQRGFQANSRVITVSDSMLEELVNLKRS